MNKHIVKHIVKQCVNNRETYREAYRDDSMKTSSFAPNTLEKRQEGLDVKHIVEHHRYNFTVQGAKVSPKDFFLIPGSSPTSKKAIQSGQGDNNRVEYRKGRNSQNSGIVADVASCRHVKIAHTRESRRWTRSPPSPHNLSTVGIPRMPRLNLMALALTEQSEARDLLRSSVSAWDTGQFS